MEAGLGGQDLTEELWRLCAGPLVELPRENESVYYFPQGHMKQLPKDARYDGIFILMHDRPRLKQMKCLLKLLCSQSEITASLQASGHLFLRLEGQPSIPSVFSILRRHATEFLPLLDMSQPIPTQELVAKDLHGLEWRFKHIFRGQPRRHLLTTGWSIFVTAKRLIAGDAFVFLRGESGELRVGVRRLAKQQSMIPASVISTQNMHLGVLATASHALSTGTLFIVCYKPRSSQFVVGVNKFLEAVKNGFTVGMRFKMKFEGEDVPEKWFTGTVVGIDDVSSQWADSKWRSLKVQWDEATSILRPDRVSPWEIESFNNPTPPLNAPQPVVIKNKRPRLPMDMVDYYPGLERTSTFWYSGTTHSHDLAAFSVDANSSKTQVVPGYITEVPTLKLGSGVEEWKKPEVGSSSCRLFGIDLMKHPKSTTISEKAIAAPAFSLSVPSIEGPPKSTALVDESDQQSGLLKAYREQKQGLDSSPKEIQSKHQGSTRSRTKVHMQGMAVGRAVNLTNLEGYGELMIELEQMFDIEGELQLNKWEVVFTDDKGDMMLVGDDPWPLFCKMVRKMFIYTSEEAKRRMKPKYKLSAAPSAEAEEARTRVDAACIQK